METDTHYLKKRYSEMSAEEFARIDQSDLREEAKAVYDEELRRRSTADWKAIEAQEESKFRQRQEVTRQWIEEDKLRNKWASTWAFRIVIAIAMVRVAVVFFSVPTGVEKQNEYYRRLGQNAGVEFGAGLGLYSIVTIVLRRAAQRRVFSKEEDSSVGRSMESQVDLSEVERRYRTMSDGESIEDSSEVPQVWGLRSGGSWTSHNAFYVYLR